MMMNDLLMNPVLGHLLRGAIWIAVCLVAGLVLRQTGLKGWLGRAAIGLMLVIAVVPLIPGVGVIELLRPVVEAEAIVVSDGVVEMGAVSAEVVPITSGSGEVVQLPVQRNWGEWLVWGWAVGVGVVLARLFWGQLMLWRFARGTRVLESARWDEGLKGLVDEVSAAKRVKLVTKSGVGVPVTWGWLWPKILVPEKLVKGASDEEVDMVLRHELSHVGGGDYFFGLLGRLGVALHWVNPLAWVMDRWVARTREESADLAVLDGGHGRTEYAAFLVRLASGVKVGGASVVAMARSSSVPGRVEKILAGNLGRGSSGIGGAVLAVVVGVGLVLAATVFGEDGVESEVVAENGDSDLLYTRLFAVPGDFEESLKEGSAVKFFLANGVKFGIGASVDYKAPSRKLTARNTIANLNRIEAALSRQVAKAELMIQVKTHFVEVPSELLGGDGGEGGLLLPLEGEVRKYSEAEIQVILRAVTQVEGASVLSAPSLLTTSGKKATIEVGNEENPIEGYRLELEPEVLGDGKTIEVKIDLDRPEWKTELALTDGGSVVFAGQDHGGLVQLVLVGATIIDATGQPIRALDNEAKMKRLLEKGLGENHPEVLKLKKEIRKASVDDVGKTIRVMNIEAKIKMLLESGHGEKHPEVLKLKKEIREALDGKGSDSNFSERYLEAYLAMMAAQKKRNVGEQLAGLKLALAKFDEIAIKAPEWNPPVLAYRRVNVKRMIEDAEAGKLIVLSGESIEEKLELEVLESGDDESNHAEWYLDAYLTMMEAQKKKGAGERLVGLKEALAKFDEIAAKAPEWNPKLLAYRRDSIEKMIAEVGAGKVIELPEESAGALTEKKLKQIAIPRLEFENVTLKEAIEFLSHKASELDNGDPEARGINFVVKKEVNLDVQITLSLLNVPLGEALRYVTDLSEVTFGVDDAGTVVIQNTEEVVTEKEEDVSALEPKEFVEKKLKEIVIPKVVFQDASSEEVLDFLRMKSIELDSGPVEERGFKMVVKAPKGNDAKISMSLANVSLGEALRYVAELSGMKYFVNEMGAVIIEEK